uniref:hypothetical protein n=1 Tax=uncultured Draconibacterium sp. TaxID=1573823 RepID=UPI0032179A54
MKSKTLSPTIGGLKRITLFLLLIPLCVVLLGAGCDDEDIQNDSNVELFGKWKFIAFGQTGGSTINAKPDDCNECYVLIFKRDSTMEGKSVLNMLGKNFTLSGNQLIFPDGVLATEILEEGDPLQFTNALENIQSFDIVGTNLKLFYTDDNFLLFNLVSSLP